MRAYWQRMQYIWLIQSKLKCVFRILKLSGNGVGVLMCSDVCACWYRAPSGKVACYSRYEIGYEYRSHQRIWLLTFAPPPPPCKSVTIYMRKGEENEWSEGQGINITYDALQALAKHREHWWQWCQPHVTWRPTPLPICLTISQAYHDYAHMDSLLKNARNEILGDDTCSGVDGQFHQRDVRVGVLHKLDDEINNLVLVHALQVRVDNQEAYVVALFIAQRGRVFMSVLFELWGPQNYRHTRQQRLVAAWSKQKQRICMIKCALSNKPQWVYVAGRQSGLPAASKIVWTCVQGSFQVRPSSWSSR